MAATVKCIIKDDYVQKDGMSAIRIRVTINRKKYEYGLDIYEHPYNFDKPSGRIRKYKPEGGMPYEDKNYIIEQEVTKCRDIIYHYQRCGFPLSIEKFKEEKLSGIASGCFLEFMQTEIDAIKKNKYLEKSTIQGHENTLSKLKEFRSSILFFEFSHEIIIKFDRWLTGVYKCDVNTRWKHHKNIKKFINEALNRKIRFASPYKRFNPPRTKGNRIFLSHTELQKLIYLHDQNILSDHLQSTLNRYLFSFYACGLRYSDTEVINWKDFNEGRLTIIPRKSRRKKKILVIPLHDDCFRYIENQDGNFFNSKSDTTLNNQLKEICQLAGIKKHVTFHTARHTFATWYLDNGGRLEVLQRLLGHSKIEDTMIYVHITETMKKDSIKIFDDLLRSIIRLSEGTDGSL